MGRSVNKREMAEIVGVSERTLTEWQDLGMPISVKADRRGQENEYDTQAVIEWYVRREVARSGGEPNKDRLARLQGDKVQLEIYEKLRKLIPADELEPAWAGMVLAARSFLRAEPERLAHLLEMTEGLDAKRDLLVTCFDEFLQKLSEYDPGESAEDIATAGMQTIRATAENVGGGMGGNVSISELE